MNNGGYDPPMCAHKLPRFPLFLLGVFLSFQPLVLSQSKPRTRPAPPTNTIHPPKPSFPSTTRPTFRQRFLQKADLKRIAFIGASVSDGFGNGLPPATLAKKALKGRGFTILRYSNSLFFMKPLKIGSLLMQRSLRAKPTLLIGIDYLFWFGYGWLKEGARMKRLEKGLALMDQFKGKILVGNLPDMHGADPKMLAQGQIPSLSTLKKINARIAQWAKKRDRVKLFDLSSYVHRMKEKGILVGGTGKEDKGKSHFLKPKELMSRDRLHPSKKGVHVLLHFVLESLRKWGGPSLKGQLAWDYAAALNR